MVSLLLRCVGCRHGVRPPVFEEEQGVPVNIRNIFISIGKWLARMTAYKRANRIFVVLTDQASLLIWFIPAQSSGEKRRRTEKRHLSISQVKKHLIFSSS